MNQVSLYIHVPFCARKCLFCSFVIAVGQEHRREEYIKALVREMKKHAGACLKTVYLGGGTPSLLDSRHLDFLMQGLRKNFLFAEKIEVSIEANPESVDAPKARFLKSLGFNRVSLGVQSMDERYLKFLGRSHDASKVRAAYGLLREAGFSNINLDLMYGFPHQTTEELMGDARLVASLGSEHLSLYTLTIEPNSRFFAAQMKLDDDEKLARHYELITRTLLDHGFKQYEISNFSRPGFESAHNKNYWLGGAYIGLGVGAHGFDGHRRSWNTSNFQEYLKNASEGENVIDGFEDLTPEQLVMEQVLFGLRMNEGIGWGLVPSAKRELVNTMIDDGFLRLDDGRLRATESGRLVLDELSVRLI